MGVEGIQGLRGHRPSSQQQQCIVAETETKATEATRAGSTCRNSPGTIHDIYVYDTLTAGTKLIIMLVEFYFQNITITLYPDRSRILKWLLEK